MRLAAIVTTGDPAAIEAMAASCSEAARAGARVAVFFRDESIPAIRGETSPPRVAAALEQLAASGDVRLSACSTSLYLWGLTGKDLIPSIGGVRGLVAFLAEDVAGASSVLTY
jgi:peroxiredoxin family protein